MGAGMPHSIRRAGALTSTIFDYTDILAGHDDIAARYRYRRMKTQHTWKQ
jgi:hypothetical protein